MKKINSLIITDNAIKQIKKIYNKSNSKLLLFIKKNGCYGYSYKFKIIKNIKNNKNIIEFSYKDIYLYFLKKDINIINNTILDYIKEDLNYKFIFNNINLKNVCGCGKSFSI